MPNWLRARLVWNWKDAYKWMSIQFIALGAGFQLSLLAFPDTIRGYLPDPITHGLAIFCLAAAAYGRVTTQPPKDDKNV